LIGGYVNKRRVKGRWEFRFVTPIEMGIDLRRNMAIIKNVGDFCTRMRTDINKAKII